MAGGRQPSGCDGPFVPGAGVAGGSRLASGAAVSPLEGGTCSAAGSGSVATTLPDDPVPADRTEPVRTFDRQLAQSPVKTGPHSSYGVAHIVQPAPATTQATRIQPSKVRHIEDSLSQYLGANWNDGDASFPILPKSPYYVRSIETRAYIRLKFFPNPQLFPKNPAKRPQQDGSRCPRPPQFRALL